MCTGFNRVVGTHLWLYICLTLPLLGFTAFRNIRKFTTEIARDDNKTISSTADVPMSIQRALALI